MHKLLRLAVCLLLIMGFAAYGAEPEIQVAVEKSGDAFLVDATIIIPVPLRTAWEVLTDFDNMVGILSNLTVSKIIRRKGNSVFVMQEGNAKFGFFSYSFASVREIQLEPMRRIFAIQLTGNAKRFESEMELSETVRGTRITTVPKLFLIRASPGHSAALLFSTKSKSNSPCWPRK
jgi:hypothetical protein